MKNMAAVWATDEVDKLLANVEKHEVIWKIDHPNYGKRGPKDAAYRKIAVEFQNRGKSVLAAIIPIFVLHDVMCVNMH